MKVDIVELIPKGKGNGITSCQTTHQTKHHGATLRKGVNDARSGFVPIGSDDKGYFIAETPEELNHTIAQINSRVHMMIRAREGLKKAQKRMMEEKNNGKL